MTDWAAEGAGADSNRGLGRRQLLKAGGLLSAGAAAVGVGATAAGAQVSAENVTVVSYLPVNPARVFDSRTSVGPLHAGQIGTIQTNVDPTVIYGAMYNVTLTSTVGAGYVGVFPGDIAWPGNSSVNWFVSNEDICNNVYVRIPPDGTIKIACGGSPGAQTHIIFDVNAAGFLVNVASPTSVDDATVSQPFTVVSIEG